jgi:alpha-amylase
MKSINLIFGCHSHQPVGNFDFVFESAYELSYKPFIEVLERYPLVKCTLHYTGPLFDWFVAHRPEYMDRLRALVQQGQVEIMGGGYYEPLLCAIPERDAIAQIHRMQDFCEAQFGTRPRGMWLTERVWEPMMARTLARAGVEYTVLDDMHFKASGVKQEDLFGYYTTEDEGLQVKVFPIIEHLRYTIPFQQVARSIEFLRENATECGTRCAVIQDDGEKFGVWPHTHQSVYGEGWLEEFFQALTDNREWLHCLRYEDYLASHKALGRTYITCASYREMMGWTLPTPMQRELNALEHELADAPHKLLYVRGGFWRNFLAKYPESNNMQKRMLRLSARVNALREHKKCVKDERFALAEKLLHEGQCNCAYWHGVFGGLYLNHLRDALYNRIIAAGALLDELEHGDEEWVRCEVTDFDADGHDEVILENRHLGLYFSPSDGGTLFEIDYKPLALNVINSLARREEAYHDSLRTGSVVLAGEDHGGGSKSIHDIVQVKEAGLEKLLVYDAYRRVTLRDHLMPGHVDVEALWANVQEELGTFATGEYAFEAKKSKVTLSRSECVGESQTPITIRKRVKLPKDASHFKIRYDLENSGDRPFSGVLAAEFVVNVLTGHAHDRYVSAGGERLVPPETGAMGAHDALTDVAVTDEWKGLRFGLQWSTPARVYRFPLETVSQSEGGQERVYQATVLLVAWDIEVEAGQAVQFDLTARAETLPETYSA